MTGMPETTFQADFISDNGANYYHDRIFDRQAVMLLPGHYVVSQAGLLLVTVLGSCIATCLRDPVSGVCGMNHFMLPSGELTPFGAPARYGSNAMELLINEMLKSGASRHRLEAKLFGGGHIQTMITSSSVGQRNANFARQYLAAENIKILSEDLYGFSARKVYFFTDTGVVKVKRLEQDDTLENESRYQRVMNTKRAGGGSVELF